MPDPFTRVSRKAGLFPVPERLHRHHPDFDKMATQGWKSLDAEGKLSEAGWRKEQQWALDMGLPGADSLTDKSIPTFSRGELPHFAGINTFLKAPYVENVRDVAKYDAAVLGIPFDSGTTYRPGTRFGPQGIRRISALYTPYNYELGVDLREQMTLCDAGDVFTIPGNLEKSFDQISRGVAHVFSSGALPLMLGGDHSIGFPVCARHRAMHEQTHRHHPLRPPHRHPGEGSRRAHAHHALVLGDQPAQCLADQSGATRHRRLAGAARRCAGGAQAQHQCAHHRRYREDRPGEDRRDRARTGLEGRRRSLYLVRRRTRSTAVSCRAPAGRSRAVSCRARRSSCWAWSRPKACAGWRWWKCRRLTTRPTLPLWSAYASWSKRSARWWRMASSAATRS